MRISRVFLGVFCAFALSGCAETEFISHYAKKLSWPGQEESTGAYKVGNPYKVGSVWYYPQEDFHLVETGIASWYGPDFHGKKTANGEIYDQNELTAAHRTLQMPSFVRVTNLENGRSVVVRINDRGPYLHGRVLDMSKRAAELLGFIGKGTAKVRIEVLTKESQQVAEAAKRGMDTSRLTLADLDKIGTGKTETAAVEPASEEKVKRGASVASLENDAEMMPESLVPPSITVEELSGADQPASLTAAPEPAASEPAQPSTPEKPVVAEEQKPAPVAAAPQPAPVMTSEESAAPKGHLKDGRWMPDPVVSQAPVVATGIFVQAGSFSVKDNAVRLVEKLKSIGPAKMEEVTVKGQTMYRVKLGPFNTVGEADQALDRVIRAGHSTAKIVRH